jgi:Zn-dependent protease with chaperone function
MRELAIESILHAVVGTFLVRSIAARWGIPRGRAQLRLRGLALILPPLLPVLFLPAASVRGSDGFRRFAALFDSARLDQLRVGPFSAGALLLALSMALGLLLLLRDFVPLFSEGFGGEPEPEEPGPDSAGLEARLARLSPGASIPIRIRRRREGETHAIFCRGILRPAIWVDRSVLTLLSPEELDAALLHELSHARHRDGALGWAILAWRVLFAWNPAVQVAGRSTFAEFEHRADEEARRSVDGGEALARALRILGPDAESALVAEGPLSARLLHIARHGAFARRLSALEFEEPLVPPGNGLAELFLVATGVAVLLFFVI